MTATIPDLSQHPCFSETAKDRFARVHLPVARTCNIKCRYCDRQHDCINESRPGVTSRLLAPHQALWYLKELVRRDDRIRVVGIAGPGEVFATPDESLETLRLVRESFPEMLLCVASNGLRAAEFAEELAELAVSHVTITLNAVDPAIGERIYSWARPAKRPLRGRAAAECLLERQLTAIEALVANNILVKINTVIIPGVNDTHAVDVARTAAALGASTQNCLPLYPTPHTDFAEVDQPSNATMAAIRRDAGAFIPQMRHCGRCRADAAGILGEELGAETIDLLQEAAEAPLVPEEDRPFVAVATHEGLLVNRHLGETDCFWVYEPTDGMPKLVATRQAPPVGGGQSRWQSLADTLHDCRLLLASGAGPSPRQALARAGLKVVVTEGLIEDHLRRISAGLPPREVARPHQCGSGCGGDGTGCG